MLNIKHSVASRVCEAADALYLPWQRSWSEQARTQAPALITSPPNPERTPTSCTDLLLGVLDAVHKVSPESANSLWLCHDQGEQGRRGCRHHVRAALLKHDALQGADQQRSQRRVAASPFPT